MGSAKIAVNLAPQLIVIHVERPEHDPAPFPRPDRRYGDDRELRRAMAVALAAETPRTPADYQRFYARVIDELHRPRPEATPASIEPKLVAV